MSKQVRILSGLHRGAEVTLAGDDRCVVGSDAECSIVLFDPLVAPRHCVLQVDEFGVTCRALDASVSVDSEQLAPGEVTKLEDFTLIRCGQAALSVGPAQGDWKIAEQALHAPRSKPLYAVRSLRQLNPYALFATVLFGITCVIGLAYAALSDRPYELTASRVDAARAWLKKIAPAGSELTIGADAAPSHELLLTGYVRDDKQMRSLLSASRASDFTPRVEVYAIDEMTASMDRLLRLAQLPCELQYQGSGQFACSETVPSDSVAMRLRTIARDVPGLRALQVTVVPPPVVAAEPAPPPPVVTSGPVRLTQKFSVLMFRNERFLIGQYGERYREGEQFDGFTINRIGVDKIWFERDGREFEFYVAALRTAK
jgi:type III secretion system YscD/HrpQ family protein